MVHPRCPGRPVGAAAMTAQAPAKEEVWRWYECGRKVPHTREAAEQQAAEWNTIRSPYRCPYADHWHVGRKPQHDNPRYRRRHARFQKALRAWRLAHTAEQGDP